MENITSKENRSFKELVRLSSSKYRNKTGLFKIEGPNLVKEALELGVKIKFLAINGEKQTDEVKQIVLRFRETQNLDILYFSDSLFQKICNTVSPQAICAVCLQSYYGEEEFFRDCEGKNFVLLDGVQDPGNVGTIMRTAEAAGYAGVISAADSADIYSPKVVRACAGTLFRMPILKIKDTAHAISILKKHKKQVACLAMTGANLYYAEDLKKDLALVLGNEGNGVCIEALLAADRIIKIPMKGKIESLNVAIAAAIVMYESMRV